MNATNITIATRTIAPVDPPPPIVPFASDVASHVAVADSRKSPNVEPARHSSGTAGYARHGSTTPSDSSGARV